MMFEPQTSNVETSKLSARPETDWTSVVIDIPKGRRKRIHYLEGCFTLDCYEGTIRQISVTSLGRERPTPFLSNHPDASPRKMITNVNFFHMNNLSSEVCLNVDLDVTLTVIANGLLPMVGEQAEGIRKGETETVVAQVHRDQRCCRSDTGSLHTHHV